MTTTPFRQDAKENNYVDSFTQLNNGVVARNTILYDADGNPVSPSINDIVALYKLSDVDEASATVTYLGYVDKDANWYIEKIDETSGTTFRFIKGTSGYTTNWTNRASLTYDYLYNTF